MAYNKKNYYKKVIQVQNVYTTELKRGRGDHNNSTIYYNFIQERFLISKRTFDEYLGIPAKRELDKLINPEKYNL